MTSRAQQSAASLNWMGGLLIVLAYLCLTCGLIGGLVVFAEDRGSDSGEVLAAAIVAGGVAQFALFGALGFWARTYAATVLGR